MEVDGFAAFAGSFSLIPGVLSLPQCEAMARDVLARHPLLSGASSLSSALLYPQFQLLLCLIAIERAEASGGGGTARGAGLPASAIAAASAPLTGAGVHKDKVFAAKKVTAGAGGDHDPRPGAGAGTVADQLSDLLREMGIDKSAASATASSVFNGMTKTRSTGRQTSRGGGDGDDEDDADLDVYTDEDGAGDIDGDGDSDLLRPSGVVLPSSQRPVDQYQASLSHFRQAMLLRLQRLFDEMDGRLQRLVPADSDALEASEAAAALVAAEAAAALAAAPVPAADAKRHGGRGANATVPSATATATSALATRAGAATTTTATAAAKTATDTAAATSTNAAAAAVAVISEEQEQEAPVNPAESRRLTSKPVVVGDALPVPSACPESVEQMLQVRTNTYTH
jgi:hypothetical protein